MNNDGNMDIVQSEADTKDGRVFWWENRNEAEQFVYHAISDNSTNQDFHALALADFDGMMISTLFLEEVLYLLMKRIFFFGKIPKGMHQLGKNISCWKAKKFMNW